MGKEKSPQIWRENKTKEGPCSSKEKAQKDNLDEKFKDSRIMAYLPCFAKSLHMKQPKEASAGQPKESKENLGHIPVGL